MGRRDDHDGGLGRLLSGDARRATCRHGSDVLRRWDHRIAGSILASVLVPTPKASDPPANNQADPNSQATLTDIRQSLTEIHRELAAIQCGGTDELSTGT